MRTWLALVGQGGKGLYQQGSITADVFSLLYRIGWTCLNLRIQTILQLLLLKAIAYSYVSGMKFFLFATCVCFYFPFKEHTYDASQWFVVDGLARVGHKVLLFCTVRY